MTQYYYPPEIAAALSARWPAQGLPLPAPPLLTQLVMVAYQASLLQEEGRPVSCYLLYASPEEVATFPVAQQHHLVFAQPRPCNEQELRRLSPTVQRGNSALAVYHAADDTLQIWGVVFLGASGDYVLANALDTDHLQPSALLLHVRAPGALTFYCGRNRVLTLLQGRIEGHGFLQFPAAWAQGHFNAGEDEQIEVPAEAVEVMLGVGMQLLRRSIGRVRNDGHGGMLVLVPNDGIPDLLGPQGLLRPKYRVEPDTHHFVSFLEAIIKRLTELNTVSWRFYQQSADAKLRTLSHQMDWFTELLADLMAVDGALVISQHFDVMGFGVEIHAPLVTADHVFRALDVEAHSLQAVPIDSGGTRHRAAYRLCAADARCLVVVVSQDGAIKFVRQLAGKVVFWDQLAL
ncbi:putative sensor domain DACNV-containing protein [Hymenobacter monticola]|uniref:DNA integrity scanning protein DisA nucleotide-binding domain protein n=1 Tax=Hymenobacter monticola TaxID=1705399 RepID=A0ABY4BBA0_9BACT|nr:diadenylate cyclase [Hymenobacter monticola]UOE36439.1 DNA integrity scanning protein DisA nucleotide-binding domain protein [Hymenobacter monticola]